MSEEASATQQAAPARRTMRTARTNRGKSIREEGTVEAPARARTGRKRRGSSRAHDPFYVPQEMIPPGMSAEWKRLTVHGKQISASGSMDEDPSYMLEMEDQGWTPATTDQFPGLAGKNVVSKSIVRKGMILMLRPVEYTEEAREEDEQAARSQVRDAFAKLTNTGDGEMDRKVMKLKRSYDRPPVDAE